MANDNKNTHELASDLDDDTSELELLPSTYAADPALDYESESDAATHSFESLDTERERKSLGTLQVELRERDDYIGRLEYDLEQLRARSSGLETELRAREALTEGVAAELRETRQALAAARERLERRERALAEVESRLDGSEASLRDAREAAESARSAVKALEARAAADARRLQAMAGERDQALSERQQAQDAERDRNRLLAELEARHVESQSLVDTLRQYIEGRKERWEQQALLVEEQQRKLDEYAKASSSEVDNIALRELTAARDRLREELERLQQEAVGYAETAATYEDSMALQRAEIDSLATRLAEISSEYEKESEERQSLEAQCNALEERVQRLASERAKLAQAAERTLPLQQANARLAGEILGHTDEIRRLREQAERIEGYADTLRRKLQDQAAELETLTTSRRSAQAALEDALAKVAALREEVDDERRGSAELAEAAREEQERLSEELRRARGELEAAREAVAESQATNEQLASDLIETTGSKLALESQLSRAAEDNRLEIEKLERRVKRLQQDVEEYEGKLANKDATISVLLAELSGKPQAATSEVQADGTPHRPAERRAHAAEERHGAEKERTTRLLVGTIDGQEVRFPLFKNKLTIGRTAHNDIQLKQQFISRRHAVVVCDNDSTRIVDWGSKNGIYVNGVRVSEKVLKSGDQLSVGTAEFRFEERPKR